MTVGRVSYVTGISGTGVRTALTRYQVWCKRNGLPEPAIVGLEDDYLVPLARPYAMDLLGLQEGDVDIVQVLRLPKPLLDRLWGDAFESAASEARKAVRDGNDAILTFHAAWYHLANRQYLSCLDLGRMMRSELQPNALVTLLDDIYEVRSRLSQPGGLFSVPLVPQSDYLDAIFKLSQILDWRDFEAVLTNKVADICGSKHYLLATKHPIRTFHELISGTGKKLLYLAHPISQVRRMKRLGKDSSARAEELMGRIGELALLLRDDFVVFEPTAVDELRFDDQAVLDDEDRVIVPRLSWRWPLPSQESDDLLYEEPKAKVHPFGDEWAERAEAMGAGLAQGWSQQDKNDLKVAAPPLRVLWEKIRMQIKSRDYTLVSQADGMVVYRPIFEGNESSGVHEEILYQGQLAKSHLPRALTVVLHPDEDENEHRCALLKRQLRDWHATGRLEDTRERLACLLEELTPAVLQTILAADTESQSGGRLMELADEFGLTFQIQSGVMGSDPIAVKCQTETELGELVHSLTSYVQEIDDPKTQVITEHLSVIDLAHRVRQLVA